MRSVLLGVVTASCAWVARTVVRWSSVIAVIVVGCGSGAGASPRPGVGTERATSTPPSASQTRAPTPPGRRSTRGYAVSVYAGTEIFNERRSRGRYRLVVRRRADPDHVRVVRRGPTAVLADLGSDSRGHVVAVFARCRRSCSIVAYDTETQRTRVLPIAVPPGDRVRRVSLDRGTVTFIAVRPGPQSVVRQARADGSRRPTTLLVCKGSATALDTSREGVAFVIATPRSHVPHRRTTLYLRRRGQRGAHRVESVGFGEEGGSEIVSVSAGTALTWAVAGADENLNSYGELRRLDLRSGRRTDLFVAGSGIVSASADPMNTDGPILVARDPVPNSNADGPTLARQTLAEIPADRLR